MLFSRRTFLKGASSLGLGGGGLGSYAFGVEPGLMLDVKNYAITPPGWPESLPLRIAVIADIHACEPYMSAARIASICDLANAMSPDLTVILGDFNGGHNYVTAPVLPHQWGEAIARLFESEKDPIKLIKLKELYEVLEIATDKAEDAANVIAAIVLKNA